MPEPSAPQAPTKTPQLAIRFPQPVKDKSKGACFLTCVYGWIAFGLIGYNLSVLPPLEYLTHYDDDISWGESPSKLIIVGMINLVFVFFIISFTKAAFTDPGSVPPHYGFYMGDEAKRMRYCKICHVWKPERAHHCSTCKRCILQMDHHCIWINNCVGFYNRKFFVQLICYGLIWLAAVCLHGCYFLVYFGLDLGPKLYYGEPGTWLQISVPLVRVSVLLLTLFSALIMLFSLIPLAKMHFVLMLRNSTTLEGLGGQPAKKGSPYDLGKRRNIEQVLGPRPCLWIWPCHTGASRPKGDGVRWRQDYARIVSNDTLENG